jgi:putative transposase
MELDPKYFATLVKGKTAEEIIGEDGLIKRMIKQVIEAALRGELTDHVGYEKHDPAGYNSGNARNGTTHKKLKGEFGEIDLETPRDRLGTFEPKMVAKGQTRFNGFDDKILSMYARGMSTRDIQGHLQEMYQVEVSPVMISNVTDSVVEELRTWQNRPLDNIYPVVFLDALQVRIRDNGQVQNRAVYVAIGIRMDGCKEVLGMWTSANEGAKFWLQVLTEIQNRGVKDIYIACVDGLKGFPQAIHTVYPKAQVQLCMVHMVRASLNYVSWKQRRAVAADLRKIYTAVTEQEAELELAGLEAQWDGSHPAISQIWRRNWDHVIPFFAFPAEVRKIIYTTNAVESLNMTLRKVIKTRGSFPNEEAAMKLLYLGLKNASKKWNSVQNWKEALNRFQIMWPERMPALERTNG